MKKLVGVAVLLMAAGTARAAEGVNIFPLDVMPHAANNPLYEFLFTALRKVLGG